MNTLDVIERICKISSAIEYLQIVRFDPQKDLATDYADCWTKADEQYYRQALWLKQRFGIPFWNGLMISIKEGEAITSGCITGALTHHPVHPVCQVSPSMLPSVRLLSLVETRLGISSAVQMRSGKTLHIPMLDFHISVSARNTNLVNKICAKLGVRGFLLDSGRSYHFIGMHLISWNEIIAFLGRALLLTPIVDEIWIAHQLQEGSCTLRFTIKDGWFPSVIRKI